MGQVADVIGERNTGHFTTESLHDIAIDFTEADLARLEKTANALNERTPEIVDEMANRQAEKLAQGLKQQWQDSVPATDKTHGTRARILADWSEPLEALRMLLELCRQEGDAFNITFLKSKHPITRNEALARLHIRACRIAEEILLLIENGHTEGAQARWRTLHEVTITATLIADGGDALAERYFDHQAIELKRASTTIIAPRWRRAGHPCRSTRPRGSNASMTAPSPDTSRISAACMDGQVASSPFPRIRNSTIYRTPRAAYRLSCATACRRSTRMPARVLSNSRSITGTQPRIFLAHSPRVLKVRAPIPCKRSFKLRACCLTNPGTSIGWCLP